MGKTISKPFLLKNKTVHPAQVKLPKELSKKAVTLQCESIKGTCNVYLVGTCHVSSQSCKDVEDIISFLKPEVVFLELCESRSQNMYPPDPQLTEVPRFTDVIVKVLRHFMNGDGLKAFRALSWLVYQKDAKKLGLVPGSEFQSARREAEKYGGKVILGDRPIEITYRRTWSKMSFWYKAKFITISLSRLSLMSIGSIRSRFTQFPIMKETIIHERDLYMASRLIEVAKECKSVVAVVGRAHVTGIQENWRKPVDIDSLMEVEAATPSVALAVAGIAFLTFLICFICFMIKIAFRIVRGTLVLLGP